jgi:hypothetical protein
VNWGRPKTRHKALLAGVTSLLTKPAHIPQIINALAPYVAMTRDHGQGKGALRRLERVWFFWNHVARLGI